MCSQLCWWKVRYCRRDREHMGARSVFSTDLTEMNLNDNLCYNVVDRGMQTIASKTSLPSVFAGWCLHQFDVGFKCQLSFPKEHLWQIPTRATRTQMARAGWYKFKRKTLALQAQNMSKCGNWACEFLQLQRNLFFMFSSFKRHTANENSNRFDSTRSDFDLI